MQIQRRLPEVSLTGFFTTSDTALAAYLISQGFGKPRIERTDNECVFCFIEDDKEEIKPFVRNYTSGSATGNVCTFYSLYKHLLQEIHRR